MLTDETLGRGSWLKRNSIYTETSNMGVRRYEVEPAQLLALGNGHDGLQDPVYSLAGVRRAQVGQHTAAILPTRYSKLV